MAIVFDLNRAKPVFHDLEAWNARLHPEVLDDGWKRTESRTLCGIVTYQVEWIDVPYCGPSLTRNEHQVGTWLRPDHARLIGRPCARCYPPGGTP